MHLGTREVELLGDERDGGGGDVPEVVLHTVQHLEERPRTALHLRQDAADGFTLGGG